MDTLTLELLSYLLSNIEDEAIGQLSITSKYMGNITHKLKDDEIFFKSRVENLLGYSIRCTQRKQQTQFVASPSCNFVSIAKQNVLQDKAVDSSYGLPAKLKFSYKGDWKGFYYILIKSGPSKAYWLEAAQSYTVHNGNDLAIKVLLADKRVDPSESNNLTIRQASEYGHPEIVRLLLADQRVDPSAENNQAIQWASRYGRLEVVKLLLADQRVDPSDNNNKSIQDASWYGHLDVVKLLLTDQRVDPSDDPSYHPQETTVYRGNAIQKASIWSHLEVVKLLLGSNKINLSVKTQTLRGLRSGKLSYDMIYDNIEKLAIKSLKELIQIGNQNLQDREIIMTKYFWWLRLEILYNMTNIKEDPFKLALQLEQ